MKIVVYHQYGHVVYADGKFIGHVHSGHIDWQDMLRFLGIAYESRTVRWEDWPGVTGDSKAVYSAPTDLADLEGHFARLAEERRVERIADLKRELAELEDVPCVLIRAS